MVRRRHGSILQITCVAVLVAAVLGATAPRALADCYEPVDVSGAGTGWINGTYLHLGTASGKPAFGMPGIPLEWSGSRWEIGGSPEYANDADTLTPPSTGWYAVAGSNPAPRMSGGLECCTPISISGAPAASVAAGSPYSFTPTATGDCTPFTFNFGIKPEWADFDPATGRLWGTPTCDDVGIYNDIYITVFDSHENFDALPQFSIEVLHVAACDPPPPEPVAPEEPALVVIPAGLDDTFLNKVLPLAEGEEPPMIGSLPLAAIFEIGEQIAGGCRLLDAHGGEILGAYIKVELYRVTLGTPEKLERAASLIVRHDGASGCYAFELETDELTPGTYDVRLVFPDGSAEILRVQLVAPST